MVPKLLGVDDQSGSTRAYDDIARRTLAPARSSRIAAHVRSGSLDRALIEGSDPADSPELAARAAILTGQRSRLALADGLERLLERARGTTSRRGVLRGAAHVGAHASALHELALVLRGGAPVYAQGVAIVNQLLTDGAGPAYIGDGEAFARRLRRARAEISGHRR